MINFFLGKNIINTLLILRLTYYRLGIFERLKRFKLLVFFILATIVPTASFMFQVIQIASTGLMRETEHATYFVNVMIFQLIAMIWLGSQYDCLKIADVEHYLRTLKIPKSYFFIIEFLFSLIITLPLLSFLTIGLFFLINQHVVLLGVAHFIYLCSSLLFLSVCLIASMTILSVLLIITNLLFIYFNGLVSCILLATSLGLVGYGIVVKRFHSPIKTSYSLLIAKFRLSHFFPNLSLNLKSLLVWNVVYTACIFGVNVLLMLILIAYTLAQNPAEPMSTSFLITLNVTMFFCSLLIYKIIETRKSYGEFF